MATTPSHLTQTTPSLVEDSNDHHHQSVLLFPTYPPSAPYYVQSPSASSSVAPADAIATRLTPIHYSPSSRVSSNNSSTSFLVRPKKLVIVGEEKEWSNDGNECGERRKGVWRYVSIEPRRASWCCTGVHLLWRLALSFGAALLVFYAFTRPPIPVVSVQISEIRDMKLGEGLDTTGVVTKLLTCNCTLEIVIENHSKVFGLHLHPPSSLIYFSNLLLAYAQTLDDNALQETEYAYISSKSSSSMVFYIGSNQKPVYGAGRAMQDKLDSSEGLPLLITMWLTLSYRVVGDLVRPTYRHHAECLLVLDGNYDDNGDGRQGWAYNSTCSTYTHSK